MILKERKKNTYHYTNQKKKSNKIHEAGNEQKISIQHRVPGEGILATVNRQPVWEEGKMNTGKKDSNNCHYR